MRALHARSMEIYRRPGVAECDFGSRGTRRKGTMNVAIVTSLIDPPLAFSNTDVAAMRQRIAGVTDGSLPLEPYQVISQYTWSPFFRDAVANRALVQAHFGSTVDRFRGRSASFRSAWPVLKALGR